MLDLVVKGGLVVDGSGATPRTADVGVRNGRVVDVGRINAPAREIIDADGAIVTPGFIDIHTHFDAQASWDSALEPSASHGVTTAVMGNCGVGFAPVRPNDRDLLIDLMEGVEDIPGTALHEGITWEWEDFPSYLQVLRQRAFAFDLAAQVPHAPLRVYVMGERAMRDEDATNEDLQEMARLLTEAVEAGAVGFSTSRVLEHQAASGATVPGTFASEIELEILARAVAATKRGIFQAVPAGVVGAHAIDQPANRSLEEVELLARIALKTGVPVTYSLLQTHDNPEAWRKSIEICERAAAQGARINPQVSVRAPGSLSTFAGYHAFQRRETYLKLAELPFAERIKELRKPDVRARILADADVPTGETTLMANRHLIMQRYLHNSYVYGLEPDFEPETCQRLGAIAAERDVDVQALAYDAMLEADGRGLLFNLPLNYAHGDYGAVAEMLQSPITLSGLSDAGAHVQVICDGSMPTFALTFWARDRKRGPVMPLEFIIKKQTADNARAYGFSDRGTIAPGMRADLNVIDLAKLKLTHPEMASDLPKGGKRLLQGARGYLATTVAGVVTRRNDADTGARPGQVAVRA